jgi:hypothetical protein
MNNFLLLFLSRKKVKTFNRRFIKTIINHEYFFVTVTLSEDKVLIKQKSKIINYRIFVLVNNNFKSISKNDSPFSEIASSLAMTLYSSNYFISKITISISTLASGITRELSLKGERLGLRNGVLR